MKTDKDKKQDEAQHGGEGRDCPVSTGSVTDSDRMDWLENQSAHIFDKGQGDFRHYWMRDEGVTVRQLIDRFIEHDFYSQNAKAQGMDTDRKD